MASVSASTLVIFIAAVGIAVTVSGTMVESVTDISDSIDQRSVDVAKSIDTDVEVISDAGSDAVSNGTHVTLLVKNTGEGTLPASAEDLDLLLDGQYVAPSDVTVTVIGGGDWREGAVVRVEIARSLGAGEHRAVVIINGEREVFRFYT
ncbi:flagellar protein G [Natronomonas sp. EA1]|uniref:flagellar protein G n=1 Tax=Natronomonas sp. EA1 TaxID=3421655 RepID=UPI003EBAB231